MKYMTRSEIHVATLPSWAGSGISYDGCSVTNLSRPVAYGPGIAEGSEVDYTPLTETHQKSYLPDVFGKHRIRNLHGPLVYMTSYQVSTARDERFLVQVPMCSGGVHRFCSRHVAGKFGGSSCQTQCYNKLLQQDWSTYNETYDYTRWLSGPGSTVIRFSEIPYDRFNEAMEEVKRDASLKSFRDWDALTDLVQLPETSRSFKSIASGVDKRAKSFAREFSSSDIKKASRIAPRQLLRSPSRALRKIGSAWLAYRYFIMTSSYSLRDMAKLYYRSTCVTDRATRTISAVSRPTGTLPSSYTALEVRGTVRIGAVVTCKYLSKNVTLLQRIGLNPFVTIYEMIPYSFVVDWFFNLGDYIQLLTTPDLSDSSGACSVVKKDIIVESYARMTRNLSYSSSEVDPAFYSTTCWGTVRPSTPQLTLTSIDGLLRRETYTSYDRLLFNRSAVKSPKVQGSMTWRRWADSIALSNQLLKKACALFGHR